jgi:hypothetical protein
MMSVKRQTDLQNKCQKMCHVFRCHLYLRYTALRSVQGLALAGVTSLLNLTLDT